MKNTTVIMTLIWSLLPGTPLLAQETNSSIVVNEESHSVFTGFFRSVWVRLKTLNPASRESAHAQQTYTAGIRGAESTETLLDPYWKGDLTREDAFQAELREFSLAQKQMDQGDLESAIRMFDNFLKEFPQSDLRPNALLGNGLSQAGIGNKDESSSMLQTFIGENPNHPLVDDARQVLAGLN